MQTLITIPSFAWPVIYVLITLILVALASKVTLGWIFVPTDKSGLVEKKWSFNGAKLPQGRIIATNGEAGIQADLLEPGLHWFKWSWMYNISFIDPIEIPSGEIGIVTAKNGKTLESGFILSKTCVDSDDYTNAKAFIDGGGVMGVQRQFIRNGTYRINTELFDVRRVDSVQIDEGYIGIVTVHDGVPIKVGDIAAPLGVVHRNFQDADMFLNNGGYRGLQEEVLPPGEYFINPQFATVEIVEQTYIPIGHVGVVTMFVGAEPQDTSGDEFKHGIIVSNGQKGVQKEPLNPGRYPLNTRICKVEVVPTTNVVLNWATAKTESHELDSHLSTIAARTKDGFKINLDVSQIINIAHDEAPKVIARFGTLKNLISQVLEPTIGNYFRNSVQESLALGFITERKQKQEEAKEYISGILMKYNVVGVDTLIGDVVPPEQLMEPIREKHIADQKELMYAQQTKAEVTRKNLETASAEANIEASVVNSKMEVEISARHAESVVKKQEGDSKALVLKATAESESIVLKAEAESKAIERRAKAEAEKVSAVGTAEAEITLKKGEAVAKANKMQVDAMGQDNFTSIEVARQISEGQLQLVPMITGVQDNANSMLGLMTLESLGVKNFTGNWKQAMKAGGSITQAPIKDK